MDQEKKQSSPFSLRIRFGLGNALVLLNLVNVIFILFIVLFHPNLLRAVLSVPFLLFFPGYAIQVAVFPAKVETGPVERLVLSVGLSVVTVALTGFILNYTRWGIRLEPVLYSVAFIVFLTSIIAWQRQRKLTKEERFSVDLRLTISGFGNIRKRAITIILVVAILGALGTLIFLVTSPGTGETYTEFYILGQQGTSGDYPDTLKAGESGNVTIGITNHEKMEARYSIDILVSGNVTSTLGPVVLADGRNWEGEAVFTPMAAGQNEEIRFLLYKDGSIEPYRDLHLWLNVVE